MGNRKKDNKEKKEELVITPNISDHYRFFMRGGTANLLLMILISSITIIFPLLLLQNDTIYYSSTPFYITIVVLFVSVMYLRYWGIAIAAVTLIVSGLFLDLPTNVFIFNTLANILQVSLLLFAFRYLKDSRMKREKKLKSPLLYSKGEFYLSIYNLFIICVLVFYLGVGLFNKDCMMPYLYVLSITLVIATIAKSIKNHDSTIILYTILIAFFPSAFCSVICALLCGVPSADFQNYCVTWTLSNYIFLQTIGYICFQVFYVREIKTFKSKEQIEVSVNTIAFYLAIILLNSLIIYLIYANSLGSYKSLYFLPWILGNIFLVYNMHFARFEDTSEPDEKKRFKWYENRIVTIEKNTSGIIMIIAFMLPLSVTLMKESFPEILDILFAANIFFSCVAIGLIWIPNEKIKLINLLKTIKTISYTYSITLLLTSSIIIISYLR